MKGEERREVRQVRGIPGGYNEPLRVGPPVRNIREPNPYGNPFGGEEYVGPNSQLFRPGNQQQPPSSLRIPPGARYDPVDPFDTAENNRAENGRADLFGYD
ncbi:unnamed protein product [Sphagnum balticum]